MATALGSLPTAAGVPAAQGHRRDVESMVEARGTQSFATAGGRGSPRAHRVSADSTNHSCFASHNPSCESCAVPSCDSSHRYDPTDEAHTGAAHVVPSVVNSSCCCCSTPRTSSRRRSRKRSKCWTSTRHRQHHLNVSVVPLAECSIGDGERTNERVPGG